jgi:HD superfamily phosphohydrolase
MEFRGMETVVLDVLRTPEIQRLRRIRQLGMAHLVFPGAEHSRLVHSLGAAYLAILFGRHLQEETRSFLVGTLRPSAVSTRDLAVAALCHDLGHGPLSHTWEREIVGGDDYNDKWFDTLGLASEKNAERRMKWHELVTQALLAWDEGVLHKLLEQHEIGFSARLRLLLKGDYYIPFLPQLLSGDVDVDRADFIMRDARQAGVAYGRYDLDWLISTSTVGFTSHKKLVVGFDERKAPRVVEQFLIARRAMYDTVYHHKTVRSAEGMIGLFLRRLKDVSKKQELEGAAFVRPLIKMIAGNCLTPEELLSLDDYSLWVLMNNVANDSDFDVTARDLAKRILGRNLFKYIPCDSRKLNDMLRRDDGYLKIYEAIEPFCLGKRESYLVVDTISFSMLSESEGNFSYFINGKRDAAPIKDHAVCHHYWNAKDECVRLFTLEEAVEAVKKVIDGK